LSASIIPMPPRDIVFPKNGAFQSAGSMKICTLPTLKKRYPQFRFIILAAGRLEGEKRFDVALDVLAKVIKKYPFTGLVIVGDGSKRLSLAEKALSLGLDNNVIFEPWQDGIISHLKTANVLLLTSEYEGYGLVLIEAGLAGCPIVSSNVGIAGKLGRNDAALICEFGDISCFASAVISIIENNEARELIRARAKAFIEEFLFSKRKYLIEFKKGMEAALASKHQDIWDFLGAYYLYCYELQNTKF